MSEPTTTDAPPSKLDDTRDALHEACQLLMQDLGWPAERAHRLPPTRLVPPAVWVDVATIHQAPTELANAVAATFPVWFALAGDDAAQLAAVDRVQARGWQRLNDAHTPRTPRVQTAGPEDVDVGGWTGRALAFRVQVTLLTSTLCPQPLVQDTTEGQD